MPKIVDHDRRRIELVEATWRIIARLGMERATMREIAEEAGFANGALKPYFPTKNELVQATFEYVFARTNERVRAAADGLEGIAALRAFCREVLPLDATRIDEARIVLPFWHAAIHDPARAGLNDRSMAVWRGWMTGWLEAARRAGEVRADVAIPALVEALLTYLLGAQVTATLDPEHAAPAQLQRQLEAYLSLMRG